MVAATSAVKVVTGDPLQHLVRLTGKHEAEYDCRRGVDPPATMPEAEDKRASEKDNCDLDARKGTSSFTSHLHEARELLGSFRHLADKKEKERKKKEKFDDNRYSRWK